jgi:EpsI family protein
VVALALAAGASQVHRIRARLTSHDADPAALARLSERLGAVPLDLEGGRYVGKTFPMSSQTAQKAGADVFLSTQYRGPAGEFFRLYVGGAISNEENFHAPSFCLPAAGWENVEETTEPFVAYPAAGPDPRMRRLLLQHGGDRMLVYYWFQAGERLADHEWTVRYARMLDLFAGQPLRPTVILVLYAPIVGDVASTERSAHRFLRSVGPHLRAAISE